MSNAPDLVTSIEQIKTMTADEIEAARVSGRIDFDALQAERDANRAATDRHVARVRHDLTAGAITPEQAQAQLAHRTEGP
jgi:hypothetical protein